MEVVRRAVAQKGECFVALSGGSTPSAFYALLAHHPYNDEKIWKKIHIFLSDERFVGMSDKESNFRMLKRVFAKNKKFPQKNIHPLVTSTRISLQENAIKAIVELQSSKKARKPLFDLIVLGVGEDGHTASLFPDRRNEWEKQKKEIIVVENAPKNPPQRLSLSRDAIMRAHQIFFLVTGIEKSKIVESILENRKSETPPAYITKKHSRVDWFLDEAAASLLKKE
jgi:6-phosphogluconolactonase